MTKNLGGRQEIVLTPEQIQEIEKLASRLTTEQIADYFGICRKTFLEIRKRQPEVFTQYKKGRAQVIDEIASCLIDNALSGDTTSQVFFLKTQAGWRETQSIETKDTTPPQQLPQINIHVNDKPEHRLKD